MSIATDIDTRTSVDAVRPFGQLGREDTMYAGGKGANLGELSLPGLPVPDGFVVGAPAYAAFPHADRAARALGAAARRH